MNAQLETKPEIRARIRAARDAMDPAARAEKSRIICGELLAVVDGVAARTSGRLAIALYASMGSEVSLDELARASYDRGWRVCFPAMVGRSTGPDAVADPMEFFEVPREAFEAARVAGGESAATFLAHPVRIFDEGAQRAAEHAGVVRVDAADIDVMAVPMVAFDDAGTRLGYGAGNYDRYLPRLRAGACIVGAAFEEQRADALPAEPFDVPLARIVRA